MAEKVFLFEACIFFCIGNMVLHLTYTAHRIYTGLTKRVVYAYLYCLQLLEIIL